MATITKIEAGQHVKEVYMPYAMSTILDRALPDVRDGMKPIHRRILYAMYKAGITSSKDRAKTTEPSSETMKIHHHGNTSIEEAIALMTEQNESLLHPYIDGEGAFGKVYLKDKPSAPRYTYCRLNRFAEEYFKDVKKGIVPMIGEDEEHLQPIVLSSGFPSILVKNNSGIACAEACEFPSFNLIEICNVSEEYIKNKDINLLDFLIAPDLSTGGYLFYDIKNLEKIYNTGQGSIKLRAKYTYDKELNCIDVHEIPYNTTVNNIVDKISDLMKKNNKYKNILDVRDETGFNEETQKEEMKITIDIKKNTNVDILMANLFQDTTLETTYSINMNCLVDYEPKVLGIKQILNEWLKFRKQCVIKSIEFELKNKKEDLHLLQGLKKILLDIDKAINIIRSSKKDVVIDNLCNEFKLDKTQAEDIINMKLIKINEEYITEQIKNIEKLEQEIKDLEETITNDEKINNIIIKELQRIKDTYGKSRKTEIIYPEDIQQISETQLIEEYNTVCYLTKEGYFKKVPSTSLRGSSTNKLKEGDELIYTVESSNKSTVLVFSNKGVCYKLYQHEIDDCKPGNLGLYLPQHLQLDRDEQIISMVSTRKYIGYLIVAFNNGKIAKIDMSSFKTKTMRSKLENSLNLESPMINMFVIEKNIDILLKSSIDKILISNTSFINSKASKNTSGNQIQKQKNDSITELCVPLVQIEGIEDTNYYRTDTGKGIGNFKKKTDNITLIKS